MGLRDCGNSMDFTSFSKNGEDAKGQKDKNGDKPYTLW